MSLLPDLPSEGIEIDQLCGRQNNGPSKLSMSSSPEFVNMLLYGKEGIKFADGIKVANQMILKRLSWII